MEFSGKKYTVGVIAGTSVDTNMGVACLEKAGIKAVGLDVIDDPLKNTSAQVLNPEGLEREMELKIKGLIDNYSIGSVIIYCNSLSTAVNLGRLRAKAKVPVVTPLETYAEVAGRYNRVGIMAANCQALAGIEKTILEVNERIYITGTAFIMLVVAIEKKYSPAKIIREYGLLEVLDFYRKLNTEVLVLGCTHFPYLKEELAKFTDIHIYDPGEAMIAKIKSMI